MKYLINSNFTSQTISLTFYSFVFAPVSNFLHSHYLYGELMVETFSFFYIVISLSFFLLNRHGNISPHIIVYIVYYCRFKKTFLIKHLMFFLLSIPKQFYFLFNICLDVEHSNNKNIYILKMCRYKIPTAKFYNMITDLVRANNLLLLF